jgi:hypothetical protein
MKEDCYELYNNIRVLQPAYLKKKERKSYEVNLAKYRSSKLTKHINESFVF